MKIKVKRKQNGRQETFYQATEIDHKGVLRTYSAKEYKANPANFEVVGGLKESQRILCHEVTQMGKVGRPKTILPNALGEINEVTAILERIRPYNPRRTEAQLLEAAETWLSHKYLNAKQLVESWKERGLSPEAARIAAREQVAMAPPASDLEFWSKFKL
jgi:hypothetical protein